MDIIIETGGGSILRETTFLFTTNYCNNLHQRKRLPHEGLA